MPTLVYPASATVGTSVPLARLSSPFALLLEPLEPSLQQRDPPARKSPVGLELGLARAARADSAADCGRGSAREAFEVLPQAAHAREVVLELRELDLELALGAARMLGENVEDQLGAVDDAGVQGVLQIPLLRRAQLVVHEQRLRLDAAVGVLQLLELALPDVRPSIGLRAVLHDRADRLDAGRPRELAQLGDLGGFLGGREHGQQKSALGLCPGRGV